MSAIDDLLRLLDPQDLESAVMQESFLSWWEEYGRIVDVNGNVICPKANALQRKLTEIWEWCDDHGLPFRGIILKPRQEGISTWSTGSVYHRLSKRRTRAVIIGGSHFQSKNLLNMVRGYSDRDEYFKEHSPSTIMVEEGKWANGSTIEPLSAANPQAARSATFQILVATELAYWAEQGAADARKVLSGALSCVHDMPGTAVIIESTANGASGDFYERYQSAQTFEQFKETRTGFIRVFMPWFLASVKQVSGFTEEMAKRVVDTLSQEEKEYLLEVRAEWGYVLTPEEIEWRRRKLAESYNGDEALFEQDYPRSEETAFLSSGRRKFNAAGLRQIEMRAKVRASVKYGNFVDKMEPGMTRPGAAFVECNVRDSLVHRYEDPYHGAKYILSVDPAKGQSQASGSNPDNHGAMVIRDGFFRDGKWTPPADVCRLELKGRNGPECLLTIGILADEVAKMARHYGNCMIVVEENLESGLIELLLERGCLLSRRPEFNKISQKTVTLYGWRTNEATRKRIIETLASRIFDSLESGAGLDINSPWTLSELKTMVTLPSGRVEAEGSKHDDQAISLGMGLCCLDLATTYRDLREVARRMPQYGEQRTGGKRRNQYS
jgi:hypothetical protein